MLKETTREKNEKINRVILKIDLNLLEIGTVNIPKSSFEHFSLKIKIKKKKKLKYQKEKNIRKHLE